MNIKTFIYMILTFRRIDPIPKSLGFMVSITLWMSIVCTIFNFTVLIIKLINGQKKQMKIWLKLDFI